MSRRNVKEEEEEEDCHASSPTLADCKKNAEIPSAIP